jgi:hypothetical protein
VRRFRRCGDFDGGAEITTAVRRLRRWIFPIIRWFRQD